MFVEVNGARLFFDVEGAGLVPDGLVMRHKPALVLLHGGPGADHSIYKPAFSQLADIAQIVYLDHRGNGRSDVCEPSTWNLDQWGDDVREFCDALGIEKPIILGTSFGGFVAQAYATRHPDHPAALILDSTAAKMDFQQVFEAFERIGGAEVRRTAEEYWLSPTSQTREKYREICVPLYQVSSSGEKELFARAIFKDDVAIWFNGPTNEHGRMDYRKELSNIRCPSLVLAGEMDPIIPVTHSEELSNCIPDEFVRFERFENCGHGVTRDCSIEAFAIVREFISGIAEQQT